MSEQTVRGMQEPVHEAEPMPAPRPGQQSRRSRLTGAHGKLGPRSIVAGTIALLLLVGGAIAYASRGGDPYLTALDANAIAQAVKARVVAAGSDGYNTSADVATDAAGTRVYVHSNYEPGLGEDETSAKETVAAEVWRVAPGRFDDLVISFLVPLDNPHQITAAPTRYSYADLESHFGDPRGFGAGPRVEPDERAATLDAPGRCHASTPTSPLSYCLDAPTSLSMQTLAKRVRDRCTQVPDSKDFRLVWVSETRSQSGDGSAPQVSVSWIGGDVAGLPRVTLMFGGDKGYATLLCPMGLERFTEDEFAVLNGGTPGPGSTLARTGRPAAVATPAPTITDIDQAMNTTECEVAGLNANEGTSCAFALAVSRAFEADPDVAKVYDGKTKLTLQVVDPDTKAQVTVTCYVPQGQVAAGGPHPMATCDGGPNHLVFL